MGFLSMHFYYYHFHAHVSLLALTALLNSQLFVELLVVPENISKNAS